MANRDAGRRRWLRRGLLSVLIGFGCVLASLALTVAWLYTGQDGLMAAERWLMRCAYGCLAAAWLCALLLWRRRR